MTPLNHSLLTPFIFAVEFKFMSYPNDSTMKRRVLFSMVCAVIAAHAFAQGQGLAGINEATSLMTSYFDPATKLCYAIGAVLGLVGGIKTYGKFSSGDPDTSKTAASWFFACIFLIVAATILRSFFLSRHGVSGKQRRGQFRRVQGDQVAIPVRLRGRTDGGAPCGGHPLSGRRGPVDMHSFRNRIRRSAGMGDVPAERPLR